MLLATRKFFFTRLFLCISILFNFRSARVKSRNATSLFNKHERERGGEINMHGKYNTPFVFATGERCRFPTRSKECEFREIQYSEFNVDRGYSPAAVGLSESTELIRRFSRWPAKEQGRGRRERKREECCK